MTEEPFHIAIREHRGHEIHIQWWRDDTMGTPWEEHDGHGPVSDWRPWSSKRPHERVLCQDTTGKSACFYDWKEAVNLARRDGWGVAGAHGTPGQIAAQAAQADFDYLRRWCRDEWFWCGYTLTVLTGPRMSPVDALEERL